MEEVLGHPFFKGIDTKKLLNYQIQSPYLPSTLDLEKLRASS